MSTITIQTEMARCLERMSTLTPGSEDYQSVLGSLSSLAFLRYQGQLDDIVIPGQYDIADEQPDTADVGPHDTAVEAPDEQPAPEPAPEPETDQPKYEKAQVREALANARLKGLNVANLIHEVGANSLSGVDPARYGELMDNLAKALEGMS